MLTRIGNRREVVNMKKVNMMVYPKELVYQNYTSTRLQYVTWGGGSLVNISNKITFFHSVKRIE